MHDDRDARAQARRRRKWCHPTPDHQQRHVSRRPLATNFMAPFVRPVFEGRFPGVVWCAPTLVGVNVVCPVGRFRLTPQVFKAMKSILSRESAAVTLDSHAGALWTTWTPSWSGWLRPPLACADSLRTARVCGLLRIRGEGFTRPSDVRKPMVSPAAFVTTTCGFNVPDSTSTWHAPRGSSGGYDTDRKPLSSANVPAKTPGGPRRARTDDLRIKRTADTRSECWRSADSCVVR